MKAKVGVLSSAEWPSDMPDDRRVIALLGLVQISEEGMDNAELAKSCGATENQLSFDGEWNICMTEEVLDSFASRITADKDAEIARLTEELNEEARLNGMGGEREADLRGKIERLEHTCEAVALHRDKAEAEIERLTDLVVMQSEALTSVRAYLIPRVANSGTTGRTIILPEVESALSATAETVSAYQNEVKAKALENAAIWFVFYGPSDTTIESDDAAARELSRMASELRAKGE